MGFGMGPPASGYAEGTQWLKHPTGHRTSLDDDLDAAGGDGGDRRGPQTRWRSVLDRLRRAVRRR
jgi:hypothetical protein